MLLFANETPRPLVKRLLSSPASLIAKDAVAGALSSPYGVYEGSFLFNLS
jgi:hypothetical protein